MDADIQKAYQKLVALSRKADLLSSIEGLLHWDTETHLPSTASDIRSEQIEELSSRIHKERTSPSITKVLSSLIDLETGKIFAAELSSTEKASLYLFRKNYLHAKKLPSSFVRKWSSLVSKSTLVWAKSKENNDFSSFAPYLEKIFSLARKKAELLGYKEHPYDAFLEEYEPGLTVSFLSPLFAELKKELTSILQEIQKKQKTSRALPEAEYPVSLQKEFSHELLTLMGFAKGSFSLQESSHPFCSGLHPTDIRMTSKIDPHNPLSNIFSVLHEGGHGLYHKNLPYFGTPLCDSASYGIDESQSRFWETTIGHSLPFWTYFFPKLKALFPKELSSFSISDFYQTINVVSPSFIRIYADEVTYCLHIILRFEIEKELLEGSISVKDIPEIWKQKMQEYLGITPSTDQEGCLQDVHWSCGLIGYFPSYALGNMYAAQIFSTFEKKFSNWKELVAKGDLLFIEDFLHKTIHKYGKEYSPSELIKKATGKPLEVKDYISYLRKKFEGIYR